MTAKSKQRAAPAASLPAQDGFSLIPDSTLLALYAAMLKYRTIAGRSRIRLKQSKLIGSRSSILGHEAAAVGVAIDLLPEDTIAPARWAHSPFREINPSLTVAATLNLATRAALAHKDKKNSRIAVAFSTGRPASLSAWRKALSLAAAQNLPILFVSPLPLDSQPPDFQRQIKGEDIPLKTKNYAFPVLAVDGNDVVAVYRVASEAIAHARKGHGPSLIVCRRWNAGDPLLNMENYLIRKGLYSQQLKRQIAPG